MTTLGDGSVEPTLEQQNFVRKLAPLFKYLAFAEHHLPQLELFALHKNIVKALVAGGKEHYFLEAPLEKQWTLDVLTRPDLYAVEESENDGEVFPDNDVEHFAQTDQRTRMNLPLMESARANPAMQFIAADLRDDVYRGIEPRAAAKLRSRTKSVQAGVFNGHAFAGYMLPEHVRRFEDNCRDDSETAKFITELYPSGGVLLYGREHFFDRGDHPHLLGRQLAKGGELCTIALYQDAEHERATNASESRWVLPDRLFPDDFCALNLDGSAAPLSKPGFLKQLFHGRAVKPDVIFYVDPPFDCPNGIKVVNPNLKFLLRPPANSFPRVARGQMIQLHLT